jgi:hypothetical protein
MYLMLSRGQPMRHNDNRHDAKRPRRQTPSYLQLVRTPAISPTGTPRSDAQARVEIVPLGAPDAAATTAADRGQRDDPRVVPMPPADPTVPRLAPLGSQERRQQWPGRENVRGAAARLVCPGCGFGARIDIVDLRSRRLHLSCDRCFRMWQDRVREDDTVSSSRPKR